MTFIRINKNFILGLLTWILMVGMSITAYAADAQGVCGDGVSWSLQGGVLTVEGSGAMTNFTEQTFAPWNEYASQIQTVTIVDGVTNVGDLAFYHCTNLTMVNIPDSVKKVGNYSFAGCTSLVQLNLGEGLTGIGRSAFDGCESLSNVRLPESLCTLGEKAFYRCSSLGGITIPASTTGLGMNVFGYCYSLTYAYIEAPIEVLPYWFFYGCSSLENLILPDTVEVVQENSLAECPELSYVTYGGSDVVKEQIETELMEPVTNVGDATVDRNVEYTGSEHSDITITQTRPNTVDKNGNSIPEDVQIHASVHSPSGWQDVVEEVVDRVSSGLKSPTVNVEVADRMTLEEGTLQDLAGKDVVINIRTGQNVSWQIHMKEQTIEGLKQSHNLEIELTKNAEAADWIRAVIGDAESYMVRFGETGMNSTVSIPVGISYVRSTATLYQIVDESLEKLQSVIVDHQGRASFSLAGTAQGDYLLALNVAEISQEETIVPKALLNDYGAATGGATLMDAYGNQYTITRRDSSWGMELNQVMWILMGVILVSMIGVGVTMYMLNKRKLTAEYEAEE